MTLVRESPSGELTDITSIVQSVFGRTGLVVAVAGDYGTDLVTDAATLQPVSDSLEGLVSSDDVANDSSIAGASLSDALDNLLATVGGGSGQIMDTFQGGTSATVSAASTAAAIGDLGWNFILFVGTGGTSAKAAAVAGVVGQITVTSGTSVSGAGTSVYLGSNSIGLFDSTDWAECTFRVRSNAVGTNELTQWGVTNNPAQLLTVGESAGFLCQPASVANYQTVTCHGGVPETQNTGVPVDGLFHDFRIVRVSATSVQFYIDEILVTTHTTQRPTGALVPFVGAVRGNASCTLNVDNFLFTPS